MKKEKSTQGLDEQTCNDMTNMRRAGGDLAIAAMRVIVHYDGLHRLAEAVANWMTTIAREGGRAKAKEEK